MATAAPQGASSLPLLYKDLQPLSSNVHGDFRLVPGDAASVIRGVHAVPLTIDEFVMAQRSFPIVFSTGANPVPLALLGLNEGVNLFLEEDGSFRPHTYIPAYFRRYPFMLARLRPDSEDLSLCFDPSSDLIKAGEEGEALFTEGQPSEVTKSILAFCEQFEHAGARSGAFVQELVKAELLMDGEVSIQLEGAPQPFVYRGFQMVNEEKLKDMRGDTARKLMQNGVLPLVYAHLFSLSLIRDLFNQQIARGLGPVAAGEQGEN